MTLVHIYESGEDEPFAVRMFPCAPRHSDILQFTADLGDGQAIQFRKVSTVFLVAADDDWNPVPHAKVFLTARGKPVGPGGDE